MEDDATAVDGVDEGGHVVRGEGVTLVGPRHVPPGGVGHLPVLDVEAGVGKVLDAARVVVVEVREDHIVDVSGVDADGGEGVGGRPQQPATAALGVEGAEASVHHPR